MSNSRFALRYGLVLLLCTLIINAVVLMPAVAGPPSNNESHRDGFCNDLKKIRRIPFADEHVNDYFYNRIADAGPAAVPCLVDHITDTTKMHDPRSEPIFLSFVLVIWHFSC
jgi:hypothetical protein